MGPHGVPPLEPRKIEFVKERLLWKMHVLRASPAWSFLDLSVLESIASQGITKCLAPQLWTFLKCFVLLLFSLAVLLGRGKPASEWFSFDFLWDCDQKSNFEMGPHGVPHLELPKIDFVKKRLLWKRPVLRASPVWSFLDLSVLWS